MDNPEALPTLGTPPSPVLIYVFYLRFQYKCSLAAPVTVSMYTFMCEHEVNVIYISS